MLPPQALLGINYLIKVDFDFLQYLKVMLSFVTFCGSHWSHRADRVIRSYRIQKFFVLHKFKKLLTAWSLTVNSVSIKMFSYQLAKRVLNDHGSNIFSLLACGSNGTQKVIQIPRRPHTGKTSLLQSLGTLSIHHTACAPPCVVRMCNGKRQWPRKSSANFEQNIWRNSACQVCHNSKKCLDVQV